MFGVFGSILKPITSALTPRGTNAAQSQNKQIVQSGKYANELLQGFMPLVKQQQKYAAGFEGQRQALISQLLQEAMRPAGAYAGQLAGDRQALYNRGSAAIGQRLGQSARQGAMLMRSQGYGDGAQTGALLGLTGRAAGERNALWNDTYGAGAMREDRQLRDAYQAKRLGLINQAIDMGSNVPGLGQFGSLYGMVQNQRPVQVQPGVLETFGPLLGTVLGGL